MIISGKTQGKINEGQNTKRGTEKKIQCDTIVNLRINSAANNCLVYFVKPSLRLQNKPENLLQQSNSILIFYLFTLILVK